MSLIKSLVPTSLKFNPADASVNWTHVETLVHGPGAPPWGDRSTGDGNSAAFACLMAICTAYPEAPLRIYRRDSKGKLSELQNHPLQLLLDNPTPNGELTAEEFWFWTQWAKHAHGNAYWLKVRAVNEHSGNVVELWPISPTQITPVSMGNDWISAYRWTYAPNKWKDVPIENIVHFRLGIDDRDHRLGLAPLKRLVREIGGDDEANRFTDALLKNFAVPGLVVIPSSTAPMTEEVADNISKKINQKFGSDNRGNIAVLSREAKIEQFGFSPEELDLTALHRLPEERISAVLGVPAIVAGLGAGLDRATYDNGRALKEWFTENKLGPLWRADASKINRSLKPDFTSDTNILAQFDVSDVRAFQEDEDAKYNRLNIAVQGQRPWLSVNEAREEIGRPPVPSGDNLIEPQPQSLQLPPGQGNGNRNGQEQLQDNQNGAGGKWYLMEDEQRRPFGSRDRAASLLLMFP